MAAAAVVTVTPDSEIPAWKAKVRGMAAHYKTCREKDDMGAFFAMYRTSFGDEVQNAFVSGPEGLANLQKLHAGKLSGFQRGFNLAAAQNKSDPTLHKLGKELISDHESTSKEIEQTTKDLKDSKASRETAKQRMEEARERAKKKSNDIIDKKFDEALAYMDTLPPEKQDRAADLWIGLSNGFLRFWENVMGLVLDVIKTVIAWLANVWETVKKFVIAIKDTFVAAWNWFTGLF
ncbi:hypothetical protein Plec18170_006516 [Paecilomyces lecythidis]